MKRARLLLGAACALLTVSHAAAAPAECVYSLVGKMPLRYTGPGLLPTTVGSINGKPAEMLVSSGSNMIFLTQGGIAQHNLKLRTTGVQASVASSKIPIYETLIEEFVVGPVRATRRTLEVLEDGFGLTTGYDVILGTPFLFQADLELSLASNEMSFYVPKNCADTHLGYWQENVHVVPFEPQDNGNKPNPQFIVHINGHKLVAEISTSASISYIESSAAKRAGLAIAAQDGEQGELTAAASFQIGGETVRNAQFWVMKSNAADSKPDIGLGVDFLRAYRVLFAMSQKKLYFSHVGGEPFGQRGKVEPWIQAEADKGNANAQLILARAYRAGKTVPRDDAKAAAWLDKAIAAGNAHALLHSGQVLVEQRDYAQAVLRLRAGLDMLPDERDAALVLYIARVRNGQADLAKTELAATFARSGDKKWPQPIADFYLGKLPLHTLLEQVPKGEERRCSALSAVGDWHRAHGQTEAAKLRDDELKAKCSNNGRTYVNIGD